MSDLMPTAAVVLGGTAFVSYVYPQTPVYEFLLFPLTPLAWLFAHRLPWCGDRIASNLLLRAAVWGCAVAVPVILMIVRYGVAS